MCVYIHICIYNIHTTLSERDGRECVRVPMYVCTFVQRDTTHDTLPLCSYAYMHASMSTHVNMYVLINIVPKLHYITSSLTPSLSHSLTLSLPHSLTPSLPPNPLRRHPGQRVPINNTHSLIYTLHTCILHTCILHMNTVGVRGESSSS